jgi:hypothetical protein
MNRIALIVIALAACKGSSDDCKIPAPAPVMVTAVGGSQSDLAKEMDAADKTAGWQDLKHRWQGKLVTWQVTRQRSLCNDAAACNVRPFPTVQGVHYGWMPRLELSAAEYAKLEAGCGKAEPCNVTFQGVLSDLEISGDSPTNLRFSDVKIVSARG